MTPRERVHEAIARIKPLRGDGPNFYTVDVEGWGLSAPTTLQLTRMLWDWFNPRPAEAERMKAAEAFLDGMAA